ncbi:MAG: DUF3365 domain-containing protein [Planctomycetaceae bacterium]|nr:DUF3365 domain-containing protein [Planctomycetaceae bacterium]
MSVSYPNRWMLIVALSTIVFSSLAPQPWAGRAQDTVVEKQSSSVDDDAVSTKDEARQRARILHEVFHGTLQVIHRDYFREDNGLKIPSRSLEDVFAQLAENHGVQARWIAVDLKAMSIHNEPTTEFELDAVKAIKAGNAEYEAVVDGRFHFAGRIRLSSQCLSCHASRRTSNDDRSAGLIISMPLK